VGGGTAGQVGDSTLRLLAVGPQPGLPPPSAAARKIPHGSAAFHSGFLAITQKGSQRLMRFFSSHHPDLTLYFARKSTGTHS